MDATRLLVVALFVIVGADSDDIYNPKYNTVCSCVCCFKGDCEVVPNTTHNVPDCTGCNQAVCRTSVDVLMNNSKKTKRAQQLLNQLTCLALFSIEQSCTAKDELCKHSTSLKSRCVDRGAFVQRFSCLAWLASVVALVSIGVVRRLRAFFASSGGG